MPDLTHWKKLNNPNYLGAYSLQPNEEPVLTIKSVGLEMVVGTDGKKEECTVAHFMEGVKPMILNVTNCKTIEKVHGTPFIEQWAGKKIRIYATTVKAFGEEVEALRIRPKVPLAEKPVMEPSYAGWEKAMAALRNKEATVEFILERYIVSPENLKLLQEAANA